MTITEKLIMMEEMEKRNNERLNEFKAEEASKKAKFLYRERGTAGWNAILWYEYRNHAYSVSYGMYTPVWQQHRAEQNHIDRLCEMERKMEEREKEPAKYEESAQAGFDLFWEYVNG